MKKTTHIRVYKEDQKVLKKVMKRKGLTSPEAFRKLLRRRRRL